MYYVWMYVCMYVCTYVCMFVRMYVCTYVRMYVCTYVRMYVRMYVCTYVCTYVAMYVRMYVCTYVCTYVCAYVCMRKRALTRRVISPSLSGWRAVTSTGLPLRTPFRLTRTGYSSKGGAFGGGVQWMGVISYYKTTYNIT